MKLASEIKTTITQYAILLMLFILINISAVQIHYGRDNV